MNERTIAKAFRQYTDDEGLDETLWEFRYWLANVADDASRELVETMDDEWFFQTYVLQLSRGTES